MKKYLVFILLIFTVFLNANVRMPLLFSDGMVLRCDKAIPVWGWADANEKVEVYFNKQISKIINSDSNSVVEMGLKPVSTTNDDTTNYKNRVYLNLCEY